MTSPKTEKKLNLFQKLVKVRESIPSLKKDNEGYDYNYVSSSQALTACRDAMNEYGVFIVPTITEVEIRDHTTRKGHHEYFTALRIKYSIFDSDNTGDSITIDWAGHGLDSGEKGVGKALTYAEKYLFLKLFNVPTDKDDPDAHQSKPDRNQKINHSMATQKQIAMIWATSKAIWNGESNEKIEQRIVDICEALNLPISKKELTAKQASTLIERLIKLQEGEA